MEFLAQNWWYLLLVAGFTFMMFRGGGCCGGHAKEGDDQNGHEHMGHSGGGSCCGGGDSHGGDNHKGHNSVVGQHGSNQTSNQIEMVRDPVCGMTVNPETAIKQNVDGKTYYFCSEACRSKFVREH